MLRLSLRTRSRASLPLPQTHRRLLHDRGIWGYEEPKDYTLPDFTPAELANRAKNASLLRLVESYRRHGHRAALVDPLDLAQRPVVPALDPRRYGLGAEPERDEFRSESLAETVEDGGKTYDVSGILDFPEDGKGSMRTMKEISQRLAEVYCGGVAYEVSRGPPR